MSRVLLAGLSVSIWYTVDVSMTCDADRAADDNFEWFSGSSVKFGLQYVNYTGLERIPKASMFQFLNRFK